MRARPPVLRGCTPGCGPAGWGRRGPASAPESSDLRACRRFFFFFLLCLCRSASEPVADRSESSRCLRTASRSSERRRGPVPGTRSAGCPGSLTHQTRPRPTTAQGPAQKLGGWVQLPGEGLHGLAGQVLSTKDLWSALPRISNVRGQMRAVGPAQSFFGCSCASSWASHFQDNR